ncbi:hypothetical protein FACS189476_08630 [Spirochaetia bacterium]|nr:hypothetical protein FACS189476_08630 [Spirochaetia bacterium]
MSYKRVKKLVGLVFFVLMVDQLFAQNAPAYYHIEVYSRASNYFGDIPHFSVDDSRLNKGEAYYEFYHKNTGYAFFIYSTTGDASAITAPPQAPSNAVTTKIFEWSGISYPMFEVQIDQIVTRYMLTNKSEVEKLKMVLKYKLSVPR